MRADTQTELTHLRKLVATLQAALLQSRQENALLRQKVDCARAPRLRREQ